MLSAKEILLGEVQRSLRNEFVPREKQIPAPWELQRRGFAGLQILGPAAASAIPDILQLIEREPHRTDLWFLLERIGPSSAVAAPLLERSFPGLGKSSDPRWNDSDFHPAWLASDLMMSWGGSYREIVTKELNGKTNSLIKRVSCLWALRKDPEFARGLMPRMVKMISDQSESTTLKTAALHALGRIPKPDENLIKEAVGSYEAQFGPLAVGRILNGDFRQSNWSGTNQIPADPKAPSVIYTNWLTWQGVVGRNLSPTWTGAKMELGTRSPPGAISQVFRTTPGRRYEIRLEAATGRNVRTQIAAGDLEKIFIPASRDPSKPSKAAFEFRACSPITTLTFSGLEYEGYGPLIDHVVVEEKAGD